MNVWEIVEKEERKKKRGMRLAEGAGGRDVQIAREVAREIVHAMARRYRIFVTGCEISMDDVREELAARFPEIKVGNWAGSVFRRPEWEPVGWTQSTHKGGHRRAIRTWRLA